jgi:hypothetical protein
MMGRKYRVITKLVMKKATRTTPLVLVKLIAFALSGSLSFAAYVAPTDRAPFRRDLLPIDVETMSALSRQLTTLTTTLPHETNDDLRVAAQFLALAQALDPVNHQVDDLTSRFKKKEAPNKADGSEVGLAKTRAWRTQAWLASPEAGKDGQVLASCLGDVLAKVDPQHPSAAAFMKEQGKWDMWVANSKAFEDKPIPDIAQNSDPEADKKDDDKTDNKTELETIAFRNESASILSPFWVYHSETEKYLLEMCTVSAKTWIDKDHELFRYQLENVDAEKAKPTLLDLNEATVPVLKTLYHGVPKGGVVSLSLGGKNIYSLSRNRTAISAAAAVVASATISGNAPTGIVMGIVAKDGKLTLPKNGWELIRLITAAPGSRIVIPKSAASLLPGLLTMDDLQTFIKHDIILAENMEELISFSKKIPDPALQEALTAFAGIREKTPMNTIGPFVTNPFVIQRLEKIVAAFPQHASAQMLLMQAKGKRPSYFTSEILAHEIRRGIAPIQWFADAPMEELKNVKAETLQQNFDECRAALDPLEKLVASDDRSIYAETIELVNSIRTLSRGVKKINERGFDEPDKNFQDKSIWESAGILRKGIPQLNRKLAITLGESLDLEHRGP